VTRPPGTSEAAVAEAGRPLLGRRVLTTRDTAGELDDRLRELGAEVRHVPLIEIVDPADGAPGFVSGLAALGPQDWVVVTSRHGAERLGRAWDVAGLPGVSADRLPRVAAVGVATAEVARRAGVPVAFVPEVQTAAAMVATFPAVTGRVLVAQADRAGPTLVDGLRDRGVEVEVHTVYETRLRPVPPAEREALLAADVVTFASGSAVTGWVESVGRATPPLVAVIGPSTEAVAVRLDLKVSGVAADHSVLGLVRLVVDLLTG
jgi:uroporphyrinogen-III synthase